MHSSQIRNLVSVGSSYSHLKNKVSILLHAPDIRSRTWCQV